MFRSDTKIISIDVSSVCYARCIYCLHQRQKMIAPRNLGLGEAQKLLDIISAEEFETVVMTLTGESFHNPAIYKILEAIGKRGMNAIVVTKLYTPLGFDAIIKVLGVFEKADKVLEFSITIDSLSPTTMSKISPGIETGVVRHNLLRLRIIQSRFPNFRLSFQTVVCKHNEEELDEIRTWLETVGFDQWTPKQLQYYMSSLASEPETICIRNAYPSDKKYQERFGWRDGKVVSKLQHCPSMNPAISLDGDLLICCMDMLVKHPIGNVFKVGSVRGLLESKRFKEMSALADQRKLNICQDCN